MNQEDLSALAPVVVLGAATGARSMTGIAAVAQARAMAANGSLPADASAPAVPRALRRMGRAFDHRIATAAMLMAAGELVADKAPGAPNRIDGGAMIGRCLAGAVVGAAVAQFSGRDRGTYAAVGAASAFAGAHLSFHARRALSNVVPPLLAAMIEDAVVIGIASAAARSLSE